MTEADTFQQASDRVAGGADHRVEARAIVALMTLEEKLGCLDGDSEFWAAMADLFSGGIHRHPYPAAAVPRLGVPPFLFADGPRGCVVSPSTAFPVSMARGATFDPALEEEVGEAIGAEQRANGATYSGAVCMNLLRHPAWGRAQETYGEDPHHVGEMAAALTRGLQRHVMACMKHFALNSLENKRFTVDVSVDDRALHEVYLPHFRRVVEEGVASVMSAYNLVNGSHCGESRYLLTDVLRDEWGFDGFVTSDWILGIRDGVGSVLAGLDVEMPARQVRSMVVADAVSDGRLPVESVERCVENVIATQLRFAPILATSVDPEVRASAAHLNLARRVSAASMVVLKNDGALLPLDVETVTQIAVVGRLADNRNLGDAGSSAVRSSQTTTPLVGIREAFPDAAVTNPDDLAEVTGTDLTVVVVGYTRADEGEYINPTEMAAFAELFPPPPDRPAEAAESAGRRPADDRTTEDDETEGLGGGETVGGDRRSLRLHADDEKLIADVASRTDRFVVLVVAGSAVMMPWLDQAPAVIQVWYGGTAGGAAIGDVLTGAAEPSGRLPFSVPTDEAHLPWFDPNATAITYDLFHGQWLLDRDGHQPQFPFGFGLGYGSVELAVSEGSISESSVSARVRNIGERPTSTVVQVYAGVEESEWERPARRLVGFARVALEPGPERTVDVAIDLSVLDVRTPDGWRTEAGAYRVDVGLSASDLAGSVVLRRPALRSRRAGGRTSAARRG